MKPNIKIVDSDADNIAESFGFTDKQGREFARQSSDELITHFVDHIPISSILATVVNTSETWEEAVFKVFQMGGNYGANSVRNNIENEQLGHYLVGKGIKVKLDKQDGDE